MYDRNASCPLFEKFLAQVVPDEKVRAFLQRALGYSLTGITEEQCFFFLYGPGSNGKSTLIETLSALMGHCYPHV